MTPVTIGDATLYLGDCMEILPTLGKVDAVITDPPYGVEFSGKNTKHTRREGDGYIGLNDTEDVVANVAVPAVKECIERWRRVLVTPGNKNAFMYPRPGALGVIFYPSGAGLGSWGFTCSQPIFYYGKCPYLAKGMGSRPDSFSSTEAADKNGHPCPKPIGTMRWLVDRGSLAGETILDPFMGSGTTGVAAIQLGRKFIGIEREPKYFEIACRRIEQAVAQGQLFQPEPPKQEQGALL